MSKGQFITFEGIDGAGKTTQINALETWLKDRGIEVVRTREPGGTNLAERIREMLLHDAMNVTTETLLFFAARSEHIHDVIKPALERGAWVLSDRFTDATYAYQVGGKNYSGEIVETLERIVQGDLQPDHTVLFDIDPKIAAERVARARQLDRFEAEGLAFFTNVRNAYLERAAKSPNRFLKLDSSRAPEEICRDLLTEAEGWV